jgi:ribonuclease HI
MSNSPEIIANIDGGSRGNPGPAAYGVAIKTAQGEPVSAFAKYLGEATNNFAEYQGLLAALDYALRNNYPRLRVLTDSELMARQINGQYKVRSPDLKPLHDKAKALITRLESFSIRHVYREQNREADGLANKAMDDAARGIVAYEPEPPTLIAPAPIAAQVKPRAVAATFQDGVLRPHTQLTLYDGEEVDLEIHRKK